MPFSWKSVFVALALASSITFAGGPALAWGKIGHRVTGAIAQQHLSGLSKAKIALLLGTENLADASIWADDMRSDPAAFWQKTASPWHYVTVPGHEYLDAHAPGEGDALTALRGFQTTLSNPRASLDEKRLALRFIIHIIGDLHQPLHAGKPGDRGGNNVEVVFFGRPTNLHSVWDSGLVEQEQLSYSELTEKLMRQTTAADVVAGWTPDPLVWISESTELRDRIYPADPKLGYEYVYRHQPIVNQRLKLAGIRMAAYLNDLMRHAAITG